MHNFIITCLLCVIALSICFLSIFFNNNNDSYVSGIFRSDFGRSYRFSVFIDLLILSHSLIDAFLDMGMMTFGYSTTAKSAKYRYIVIFVLGVPHIIVLTIEYISMRTMICILYVQVQLIILSTAHYLSLYDTTFWENKLSKISLLCAVVGIWLSNFAIFFNNDISGLSFSFFIISTIIFYISMTKWRNITNKLQITDMQINCEKVRVGCYLICIAILLSSLSVLQLGWLIFPSSTENIIICMLHIVTLTALAIIIIDNRLTAIKKNLFKVILTIII